MGSICLAALVFESLAPSWLLGRQICGYFLSDFVGRGMCLMILCVCVTLKGVISGRDGSAFDLAGTSCNLSSPRFRVGWGGVVS